MRLEKKLIINELNSKTIEKSKMHIDNWGLNFSYSYRFLQYKKLDVYGSASLKLTSSLANSEKTILKDGSEKASGYLDYSYRHSLAGAAAGLRLKYNFTDHWAITMIPEYTCYLRNFYSQSSGPFQSIRCNLGIDLRF